MFHLMTGNSLGPHHASDSSVAHEASPSKGTSKLSRKMMRPVACLLSKFLRLLIVVICTTLDCVAGPYATVESLASVVFEILSDVCGIRACGTYGPQNSAILILGAQEGLGRSAAVKFSELGYTVFALCPIQYKHSSSHVCQYPAASVQSSDVCALLYIWHNRKERSRSLPWGVVAPISLDMWSASQREKAVETVQAYCWKHELHLVALVVSPRRSENGSLPPQLSRFSSESGVGACATCEDVWRQRVLSEVTEPVLVALDYIQMLQEASGRLIILPGSEGLDRVRSLFPLEETRYAVAHNLRITLQRMGIRVVSILSGPWNVAPQQEFRESVVQDESRSQKKMVPGELQDSEIEWGSLMAWRGISERLTVAEGDVLSILHKAVESRHPKFVYRIGLQPLLQAFFSMVPMTLRMTTRWVVREMGLHYC